MNAVEIEEAVSALAEAPFDADEFPYAFLEAFGNKPATIKRLRSGNTNKSDIPGGVLQRNNIHLAICDPDTPDSVTNTLKALIASPLTASQKAKYALATDGQTLEAQNLVDDTEPPLACEFKDLGDHFGYFLTLAGITTVRAIRENAFDIKATGRLNRLYVELLKHNRDWDTAERREELNHFFARLIFCFFAEDTAIFNGDNLFTATIEQMSDTTNVHDILAELFRAMDTKHEDRAGSDFRPWADCFPYVNGGLFSGCVSGADVPTFTRLARSYLLHVGSLDWKQINPDIFGSMIQAVADDEERGALGMHYTSVPNILKVLNPLFLDELSEKLEEAGDGRDQGSKRKLLNLRNRLARIRVFDPACGSGNFLVIAYKEMRKIEAEVNRRRGEPNRRTDIPLTNYRGIELRHFACEIARLALVIAEFQCDALHRGDTLARAEFLPLDAQNWITHGNALRIDWLTVCPSTGTEAKMHADDLFETPLDQVEIDFENEGGETYICGNPPYKGSKWQTAEQKNDLKQAWHKFPKLAKTTDYVSGWIAKYLDYSTSVTDTLASFVTTNSLCQGQQATEIWPAVFGCGAEIRFAHTPFQWSNLASKNAGVTVIVIGLGPRNTTLKKLFDTDRVRECTAIGPYLVPDSISTVGKTPQPIDGRSVMLFGNMPRDGGHLFLSPDEARDLEIDPHAARYIKRFVGSEELIHGKLRYCIWISDGLEDHARGNAVISARLDLVAQNRSQSPAASTRDFAKRPHRFVQIAGEAKAATVVVPRVSSEKREFLPIDYLSSKFIVGDRNFALYDAPLWNVALIASRLHRAWIWTVCVRLRTDPSYSNTLGWNTFPVPPLSEQNKADLTRCAEDILLARESYWPATIADMYAPDRMDDDFPELRAAHERNDETLERIYIGRRFKNDTERLKKLFEMYTKMTAKDKAKS